jgi:hypothetical protein
VSWDQEFFDPIILPGRKQPLRTLRDEIGNAIADGRQRRDAVVLACEVGAAARPAPIACAVDQTRGRIASGRQRMRLSLPKIETLMELRLWRFIFQGVRRIQRRIIVCVFICISCLFDCSIAHICCCMAASCDSRILLLSSRHWT